MAEEIIAHELLKKKQRQNLRMMEEETKFQDQLERGELILQLREVTFCQYDKFTTFLNDDPALLQIHLYYDDMANPLIHCAFSTRVFGLIII